MMRGARIVDINQCSEEYKAYLDSPKWKAIRERALMRDEYKCRLCGSSEHLHVHHARGAHRFHEENHMEDIITLCEDCHSRIHLYWKVCDSIKAFYDEKRKAERRARGLY